MWTVATCLCAVLAVAVAGPPPGFQKQRVTDGLEEVTAVQFLPDGRMLVSQKNGRVFIGSVDKVPADLSGYLDLRVGSVHFCLQFTLP